jgi:hypothetical protein
MAKGKKHNKKQTEEEDFRLLKKPKKTQLNKKRGQSSKRIDIDKWEEYLNE